MKRIDIELLKTAFRKLLSNTYYDKTDLVMRKAVASFAQKLTNINEEERIFGELLSVAHGNNNDLLKKWLGEMSLSYYPKSLKKDSKDDRVISNIPDEHTVIDRLLILTNIPVELCILDIAWLLIYGLNIDYSLQKCCYGNRLDIDRNNNDICLGNSLFKRYQYQYRSWWGNGIKAANTLLKDHVNVSIINFDISNYYHSIQFDFQKFLNYYDSKWQSSSIKTDPLTNVISEIYQRYTIITQDSDCTLFKNTPFGGAIPFSLQSAHVIANWYLGSLDDYCNSISPVYYGRYVDDCMLVIKTGSEKKEIIDYIKEELPGLFVSNGMEQHLSISDSLDDEYRVVSSLELQKEKLYLYQFDCLLPESSIVNYVQEQIEKSSEYRFMSEDDMSLVSLESLTLVNTLNVEEKPGNRFNILEESRYKLAVYLYSLAKSLNMYGSNGRYIDEVEKVKHYFKGSRIIKHYRFWERIMTIFVLADHKDYVDEFVEEARYQIQLIKLEPDLFISENNMNRSIIADSLNNHLQESMLMAVSLHLGKQNSGSLYLDTFMVRNNFNLLPLQEFFKKYKSEGVRLSIKDNLRYRNKVFHYRWMPYYVSLYSIICAKSVGRSYEPNVFINAFKIYRELNHIEGDGKELFDFFRRPRRNDVVSEFKTGQTKNTSHKKEITISVVGMDIKKGEAEEVIDTFGIIDAEKVRCFEDIKQQISKVYKTDIFILPELSLPIYELINYCKFSSKKQMAFVAGMEFVVKNKIVYNHTITCLPIIIHGQRDAIPVIRLKNHYAPEEIMMIRNKNHGVPKNRKIWQNLYHWHNHIFTTYYCYELASIVERSFFFSKLDAIYCPVFNKDTGYFNSIAESTARDMHCFFILCNVSHYGDSQITQPSSQVTKNILKVKGGNTMDNKAVTLSATIDVDGLRAFQKLSDDEQAKKQEERKNREGIEEIEERDSFKQTPPNYDKKMVDKRIIDDFIYKR